MGGYKGLIPNHMWHKRRAIFMEKHLYLCFGNAILQFYLKKQPKACKVTFWLVLSTKRGYTWTNNWSPFYALKMFLAGNQLYDWSTIIYVLYLGTILGYPWIASIGFIWKKNPKACKVTFCLDLSTIHGHTWLALVTILCFEDVFPAHTIFKSRNLLLYFY